MVAEYCTWAQPQPSAGGEVSPAMDMHNKLLHCLPQHLHMHMRQRHQQITSHNTTALLANAWKHHMALAFSLQRAHTLERLIYHCKSSPRSQQTRISCNFSPTHSTALRLRYKLSTMQPCLTAVVPDHVTDMTCLPLAVMPKKPSQIHKSQMRQCTQVCTPSPPHQCLSRGKHAA